MEIQHFFNNWPRLCPAELWTCQVWRAMTRCSPDPSPGGDLDSTAHSCNELSSSQMSIGASTCFSPQDLCLSVQIGIKRVTSSKGKKNCLLTHCSLGSFPAPPSPQEGQPPALELHMPLTQARRDFIYFREHRAHLLQKEKTQPESPPLRCSCLEMTVVAL